MKNLKLLKAISEAPGASGFERKIRELVLREIENLTDSVSVDNLGNVTAFRKGTGSKRVMVAAHMDEIGFIVQHIDDKGFIRFHTLGGFDPKTLTSQRVIVHGKKDLIGVMGSKPVHLMKAEEKKKTVETTDFFIDMGMQKEEVDKYVSIGDPVTREREMIEMGDCVNGKSMDNRVSVFVLIETLRFLKGKPLPHDLFAVFTVQEEVGVRGAQVATLEIQPDFGFALDTTIAFDVPGATAHETVSKLGEGAAIKIMDGMTIADYRMVEYMKQVADRHKIKWQPEILPAGGTDTASIQRMTKSGSIAGAVSIPTRHIHQVIETCHKEDIQSCIELLSHCLLDMEGYNWSFDK